MPFESHDMWLAGGSNPFLHGALHGTTLVQLPAAVPDRLWRWEAPTSSRRGTHHPVIALLEKEERQ